MIVTAEDREPDSPAALADRLRGLGVDWHDDDVRTALVRIATALGDDARAEGEAAGMLTALASRTGPNRVRSITRLLSAVDDEQLLAMREAPARVRTTAASRRVTLADSERAARAAQRLTDHALGPAARAEARRTLPPGSTAAHVDLEAAQLLGDAAWCLDQRDNRLGRAS